MKNIQILEAENRIGGRVHTIPFGDNIVDMGAHMCHGEKGNVVWDLAKDHNLLEPMSVKFDQWTISNSNGTVLPLEESQRLLKLGDEIMDMEDLGLHQGSIGNFFMEKYVQLVIE